MTDTILRPRFDPGQDRDRLPLPTRSRHTLLRVGLQNLWEYDATTRFVAQDGRLLLRGQNESGKTKVVELSLPAVLDAILRAERLDPFGEQARPMRENLIGPHTPEDTTVAIGYVWAEFGRLEGDQPRYQTAGYGVRASRNSTGFTSWFFLTDRRVDLDLHLVVDGRPRTQRDLEEALDGRGQVYASPAEHRAAVNRTLFGFEELTQFDNLMRLLIELRRPQLAKQLRASDLAGMLNASLPALDATLLTKVAEGVDRLEEHRTELEAVRGTLRTVSAFNATYRRYLRTMVAERAGTVRSATTRVDDAGRALADAGAALERARAEQQRAADQRTELREERARLEARVRTLRESDAYRAVHDLGQAREQARRAEQDVAEVSDRLGREDAERTAVADERGRRQATVDQRTRELAGARSAADADARPAGLHGDQQQAGGLADGEDLDGAASVFRTALTQVRARIAELAPHDAEVDQATNRVDEARRRRDLLAEQAAEARTEAGRAAAAVGGVTAEFRRAVGAWADDLAELSAGAELREELDVVQVDRVRELVDEEARAHRALLGAERSDVGVRLQQARQDRDRLAAERDQLEREAYQPPPVPVWRQPRAERPGAPLYLLAAFRDGGLPPGQQAAVEGALEAAQLLDAWVHPDGRVEHPDHDLQLRPDPDAPTVGSLLAVTEPVAAGGVDQATAAAVLAGIGLGDGGRDTWVDLDGRFRAGRLRGRHTKPDAQYIGQTVREHSRQRRLAELAQLLAAAGELVAELTGQHHRLDGRILAVDDDLRRFPSLQPVADARARAAAAEGTARRAETQGAQAEGELTERREQATTVTYTRDQVAARVGLTLWAGRLGDFARLVDAYERSGAEWLGAKRRLLDAHERLDDAIAAVARAEARCASARSELDRRSTLLQQARERVATLRQVVDADGQDVLARLEAAGTRLDAVEGRLSDLEEAWDSLVAAVARAEQAVASSEQAQVEARQQRTVAVGTFRQLTGAGLVTQAVDLPDWPDGPPQEWSETAALQVARRVAEALRDVPYDEAARGRRATSLNRAFQELTVAMPPELQATPRTEHDVAIYAVVHDARECSLFELAELLGADIRARQLRINEEDARVIDEFLSGEIRDSLRRTLLEARGLVDRINADLAGRTTPSGQTVNLDWRVDEDAPAGTVEAVELLRTTPGVNRRKDEALRQFLAERLEQARADTEESTVRERLVDLLDYRRWHRFMVVQRRSPAERWTPLTRKVHGKGSGGSKAATLHLPLFAAAAAFYASARATAPRLVVLDEAFAGIDSPTTAKLLDLTVEWDLDLVMTSWREWMCFPEVPGLSIYELVRDSEAHVVDSEWFVWDGAHRREMAS
jgi:uncharacterized protein (TIGR02680 family)